MANGNAKPVKKIRVGAIDAAVWKNTIKQAKTDAEIVVFSVSVERRYKNQDGEWTGTNSYRINDIPKAVLALQKAYEFMPWKPGIWMVSQPPRTVTRNERRRDAARCRNERWPETGPFSSSEQAKRTWQRPFCDHALQYSATTKEVAEMAANSHSGRQHKNEALIVILRMTLRHRAAARSVCSGSARSATRR